MNYVITQYIPESIKDYVRIIWNNLKYPDNDIYTPNIGNKVNLGKGCSVGKDVAIGDVTIGDHSYINRGTLIASGRIGKFCSVAEFCAIGMVEHPVNFLSTSPFLYGSKNIFDMVPIWQDISHPPNRK